MRRSVVVVRQCFLGSREAAFSARFGRLLSVAPKMAAFWKIAEADEDVAVWPLM